MISQTRSYEVRALISHLKIITCHLYYLYCIILYYIILFTLHYHGKLQLSLYLISCSDTLADMRHRINSRAKVSLTNERLTVSDGHIDGVLWTNPYSEFIRCLHNVCLKVLHTLKNVIICDVNENGGGQCSRGRIISISESSLTKGHIVACCTGVVFRVCDR